VVARDAAADAERLLREFATRAFRRPVPLEEVEPYLALVQARLEQKACFQEALRVGYKSILCSPHFLYFREEPGILDDFALATRLSYFLWSSLPDEELLSLARAHELSSPQVLRAQTARMLGDSKADRFIENLTGQWLDLRKIALTEPDERLYPEFNQLLLDSMTAETRQFVAEMLKNDLDASQLVDSDFLMINGPLASLYGIEGCDGVDIRRVNVPEDCIRGGLLTQASMLKITSNGTTTSPVTRGAWILDRLLGEPVPPPPPNTPAIEPDLRGATTIGDLLKKHRSVASCSSCHAKMDPPGFALESFDVIGGWRERYRTLGEGHADGREHRGKPVSYKLGQAVDHGDAPADGSTVQPIEQLRKKLMSDKDKLARNLAKQLLVYATGAEITFSDRPAVDDILSRSRASGHGLRSLVHEVVQSSVFRSK